MKLCEELVTRIAHLYSIKAREEYDGSIERLFVPCAVFSSSLALRVKDEEVCYSVRGWIEQFEGVLLVYRFDPCLFWNLVELCDEVAALSVVRFGADMFLGREAK